MGKDKHEKIVFYKKHTYLIAPLLSAALLITAFPPLEQGYMAWFALVPFLWACLNEPPRKAFWSGFVFGLPLHLYLNLYLANVLFPYLSNSLAAAALLALVIYISLFNAFFGLAAALVARLNKAWFTALAVPSLWLLMEFLRSLGFMAYNVGYLGYTQWAYPTVLNIASVYGYWGLPFLLVFFQTILLLLVRRELQYKQIYAVSSLFVILLAAGLLQPAFSAVDRGEEELRVALIQGNTSTEQITGSARDKIVERYLDLTREAVKNEPAAELVVWPETVVNLDLRRGKTHPSELVELSEELGISLLYGARVRDYWQLFNSISLLTEGREDMPLYNKHRLVPFVEFFPMEQLLNRILDLDLLLGRYTPGEKITVFDFNGIPLSGVICFESYFGDHTRLFAAEGSRHLFVPTNDAWFGESIGLEQHAQVGAIRAAESGIGFTQVANSGITISFDHRGRELFRSGKNEAAIFSLPLNLDRRETVYARYGDYFPAAWIIFLVVSFPILLRKNR